MNENQSRALSLFFFVVTVRSERKTSEPRNPPAIVNGAVAAICDRKTCIDANNRRATRSERRNDVAFEAVSKFPQKPFVRIFLLFTNQNNKKNTYSLLIEFDDVNEEFFFYLE